MGDVYAMYVHSMQGVVCAASLRILHGILGRHPGWGTRPSLSQAGLPIALET